MKYDIGDLKQRKYLLLLLSSSSSSSSSTSGKMKKTTLCLCQRMKQYFLNLFLVSAKMQGHAVAHLVEALRYKPEGREFDSIRWCH
jgi:hypothetical protein